MVAKRLPCSRETDKRKVALAPPNLRLAALLSHESRCDDVLRHAGMSVRSLALRRSRSSPSAASAALEPRDEAVGGPRSAHVAGRRVLPNSAERSAKGVHARSRDQKREREGTALGSSEGRQPTRSRAVASRDTRAGHAVGSHDQHRRGRRLHLDRGKKSLQTAAISLDDSPQVRGRLRVRRSEIPRAGHQIGMARSWLSPLRTSGRWGARLSDSGRRHHADPHLHAARDLPKPRPEARRILPKIAHDLGVRVQDGTEAHGHDGSLTKERLHDPLVRLDPLQRRSERSLLYGRSRRAQSPL
jgi:hypothetical protein